MYRESTPKLPTNGPRNTTKRASTPNTPTSSTPNPTSSSSTINLPTIVQISRPFFTSQEISFLHKKTIPDSLKLQYSSTKSKIFQFLSQIVKILRFPQRVLATTMNYYQRFYLFNKFEIVPNNDMTSSYYIPNNIEIDPFTIAIACLFLASKVEDCIKKLRDIQSVCNKLRELDDNKVIEINKDNTSNSTIVKNNSNILFIDLQKKYILSIEFKLLQIIKFDFNFGNNPSFKINSDDLIIQFCKNLKINYKLSILSWFINYDIIQTPLNLIVPSHCIALAIIIISLNLNPKQMKLINHEIGEDDEEEDLKISQILENFNIDNFNCPELLVNEALIYILDYYIHQFNVSNLKIYLPEIDPETGKNQILKFMNLKQKFNNLKLINDKSCNFKLNSEDEYFKEWDYNIANKSSVRFMLGNKRKRFDKEYRIVKDNQKRDNDKDQHKNGRSVR
ncbi:CTK2 [Candida pseudojiufengensis]|uniref:CTK2 n=1 Tax=Candida pseudojiufengensis TaxID=497109 RepID=UPI0022247E6A|nr:CTK2 [Candida pseudojiufengensis]KAI5960360.1 CTK2 [Candida pseudojiufengensis]